MRPVVVTGVSTGIGRAVAKALVSAGIPVFGSVRRKEDAASFAAEFSPLGRPVFLDLRDDEAIRLAAGEVGAAVGSDGIGGLINNAGVAVPGPLEDLPIAGFRDQIETNLVGTLAVTQAFLPLLRNARAAGHKARIVNISSVAGATAMPFLGGYAAAKFGLEAMSDTLRRELRGSGIEVIVVQPGGVATPIWQKAAAESTEVHPRYAGAAAVFRDVALAAGANGLPAERVGRMVLRILRSRRPRTRYIITPHPMTERMMRMVPARFLDWMIARRLGIGRD
jgi:NAD(P)-dependent dehydrogenase (short-subunit alcohol dehydrogenase family)